jgi:hypothetical protein
MPAQAGIQCFFLKQAMIDGEAKMDSRFRENDVHNFARDQFHHAGRPNNHQ